MKRFNGFMSKKLTKKVIITTPSIYLLFSKYVLFFILFINTATSIHAQFLWSDNNGSAWLSAGNWTNNIIPGSYGSLPTSSNTDYAQFGIYPNGNTVGINMNSGAANQNLYLGAIEITNSRGSNLSIGNSTAAKSGILTLNGTLVNFINNVVVRNNSSFQLTLQDIQGSSQPMEVALGNITDNIINIDGTGGITISSIINGVNKNLTKGGSGTGVLSLTGANTYTGLTTVSSGTLQLNNGGSTLPSTNDVVVSNGGTFRVSSNQTLNNLTIATGGTLIIDAGRILTINGTLQNGGTVTNTGTLTISGTCQINSGGTFSSSPVYGANSILIYNTGANFTNGNEWNTNSNIVGRGAPKNIIIQNTGTNLSVSAYRSVVGDLTISNGATLSLTGNGNNFDLYGNLAQNGNIVTNNNKIVFLANSTTQTISASSGLLTLNAIRIEQTNSKVLLQTGTNLSLTSASIALSLATNATLDLNGQNLSFDGSGGIFESGVNSNVTSSFAGANILINAPTTLPTGCSNCGMVTIASNVTVQLNAGMNFGNASPIGLLTTLNGTLQINPGGFIVTNPPIYGSSSTLIYNSNSSFTVGSEWRINQTIGGGVPQNVQINNGTNLNFGTSTGFRQANGNIVINSGASFILSTGVGGDVKLGGNWINSGSLTSNGRIVHFIGATGNQTITHTGTGAFDYCVIDKASGEVTLNNDITCNQTLTLTNGVLATGANTVKSTTGSIVRTNGWINGNLQKNVTTGAAIRTFEIGDATDYTPVIIAFNNVSTAGTLTAKMSSGGTSPNINSSQLDPTKIVNRYWTVSNLGTTFDNYNASFTYKSSDLIGVANPNNLRLGKYSGSTWSYPSSSISGSTISATGINSFSEFVIAECIPPIAYNVTGGGAYCSGGSGVSIGLSNSQIGVNYQLKNGSTNVGSPITGTGNALDFGLKTDEGTYTIVATNELSCNTSMTGSVSITVNPSLPPSVSIALASGSTNPTCSGTSVTFIATPTNGGTSPSYQWKKDGANVGTNSPNYTDAGTAGGVITCVMTVGSGLCTSAPTATSSGITLDINTPPSITSQNTPTANYCGYDPAANAISVTATGTGLTYQWYYNSVNNNTTGTSFGNGTQYQSASFTPSTTGGAATTYYYCIVSGTCGSPVTSEVSGAIIVKALPTVSIDHTNTPVCSGGNAIFYLSGTSGATAYYKINGVNGSQTLGGGLTPVTISSVTTNQTLALVSVSNNGCSQAVGGSTAIEVNSLLPPSVSIAITTGTNPTCSGTSVTFTATPTNGGTSPIYQWKKGTADVGTNSATYIDAGTTVGDVTCVMTVGTGICTTALTATSNSISLAVNNTNAGALKFDGINDNVDLGNWFDYQVFSIEMWLKPGASQISNADIIDNNHSGSINWVCQSIDNNRYIFATNPGDVSGASITFTLTADTWQHVVLVKEDKILKVYIDGILVGSSLHPNPINYTNPYLRLSEWGGGGRYWNGEMDEVRIWNRVLCASEISTHKGCELSGTQAGLQAYYKFNQGIAGCSNSGIVSLTDETGNHSGTLSGFDLSGATSNFTEGHITGSCTTVGSSTLTTFYRDADGDGYGNPLLSIQSCPTPSGYVLDNTDCDDNNPNVTVIPTIAAGAINFDNGWPRVEFGTSWFKEEVFSIEMWVNPSDQSSPWGNGNNLIGFHVTDNWSVLTSSNGESKYLFRVSTTNSTNDVGVEFTLIPHTWQHLVLVKEQNMLKVYVNGILVGESQYLGLIKYNDNPFSLGANIPGYYGFPWKGSVDELRMWKRVLCQTEIQEHMNCELSNISQQNNLLAYYKFNQGTTGCNTNNTTISTLVDASGNNHNGTLVGFNLTGTISNFTVGHVTGTCALVGSSTLTTFYRDADGDGYGDPSVTTQSCSAPTGYVANSTDCNDNLNTVHENCVVKLAAKVFIEGAYESSTGLMNDGLRVDGKIPLAQPYNTLIFSGSTAYQGTETATQTIFDNNAIVDWVLIEMRSATTPSNIEARRAALLQKDGDIVDVDGISPVTFTDLANRNYHVTIRHRFCLATRTETAVSFPNGDAVIVDFTNNSNALSGSLKSVGSVYALYSGDTNRDGVIDDTDILNAKTLNPTISTNFQYGTNSLDVDFNSNVFAKDVSFTRKNKDTNQVNLNQ